METPPPPQVKELMEYNEYSVPGDKLGAYGCGLLAALTVAAGIVVMAATKDINATLVYSTVICIPFTSISTVLAFRGYRNLRRYRQSAQDVQNLADHQAAPFKDEWREGLDSKTTLDDFTFWG